MVEDAVEPVLEILLVRGGEPVTLGGQLRDQRRGLRIDRPRFETGALAVVQFAGLLLKALQHDCAADMKRHRRVGVERVLG